MKFNKVYPVATGYTIYTAVYTTGYTVYTGYTAEKVQWLTESFQGLQINHVLSNIK